MGNTNQKNNSDKINNLPKERSISPVGGSSELLPHIPNEIWIIILSYLDLESLLTVRIVNKLLHLLTANIKFEIIDYVVSGKLFKIFPLLSTDNTWLIWDKNIVIRPRMVLKIVINPKNKFIPRREYNYCRMFSLSRGIIGKQGSQGQQ